MCVAVCVVAVCGDAEAPWAWHADSRRGGGHGGGESDGHGLEGRKYAYLFVLLFATLLACYIPKLFVVCAPGRSLLQMHVPNTHITCMLLAGAHQLTSFLLDNMPAPRKDTRSPSPWEFVCWGHSARCDIAAHHS